MIFKAFLLLLICSYSMNSTKGEVSGFPCPLNLSDVDKHGKLDPAARKRWLECYRESQRALNDLTTMSMEDARLFERRLRNSAAKQAGTWTTWLFLFSAAPLYAFLCLAF